MIIYAHTETFRVGNNVTNLQVENEVILQLMLSVCSDATLCKLVNFYYYCTTLLYYFLLLLYYLIILLFTIIVLPYYTTFYYYCTTLLYYFLLLLYYLIILLFTIIVLPYYTTFYYYCTTLKTKPTNCSETRASLSECANQLSNQPGNHLSRVLLHKLTIPS